MELLATARGQAPPLPRVLLIANPASRRAGALHQQVVSAFRSHGVSCEVIVTERPGHAAEAVSNLASEFGAVFTLGGDGTAMEVIGALAHSGIPVGVLAGGTGNLISRSLGIPSRVDKAVGLLLEGEVATIDLGVINGGRRFAFAAGVGIDAQMVRNASPWLKRRLGVGAYVLAGARATLQRRVFRVRVVADGETIEVEAVAVMLANFGSVLSDLIQLGPGISQDDGCLDLCVFSPESSLHAARIAWRLLRKDFRSTKGVIYRAGRTFNVSCTPPQLFQADGEVLGMTPFTVKVEALAAKLLVPRQG